MSYDQGGRSLHYAERVGVQRIAGRVVVAYVDREATLDESVSVIEVRQVRSVTLTYGEGLANAEQITVLTREAVAALRTALNAALLATELDEWLYP